MTKHAAAAPAPEADEPPPPPVMNVAIANALTVRAPLSDDEIRCAVEHFRDLEILLGRSGPAFVNSRRDAARQHNAALERLRDERRAAKDRASQADDGFALIEA